MGQLPAVVLDIRYEQNRAWARSFSGAVLGLLVYVSYHMFHSRDAYLSTANIERRSRSKLWFRDTAPRLARCLSCLFRL